MTTTETLRGTRAPEAQGPGTERPDGSVAFGIDHVPQIALDGLPAVTRTEPRDLSKPGERCQRCKDVPDSIVAAVSTELAGAKAKR